jgi:hypothetical protein
MVAGGHWSGHGIRVGDAVPFEPDDVTLWIRQLAVVPRADAFRSISDIHPIALPEVFELPI